MYYRLNHFLIRPYLLIDVASLVVRGAAIVGKLKAAGLKAVIVLNDLPA